MNAEAVFDDSKIAHIFKNTNHNLDKLKLNPEEIYTQLTEALIKADKAGQLPINTPFKTKISINGHNVEVRAIILNGELKYNTLYLPE